MRFSRDLPSAISRPQNGRNGSPPRWIILSGITLFIFCIIYLSRSSDSTTISVNAANANANSSGQHNVDTISTNNNNNNNGGVDRTVQAANDDASERYIIMIDAGSSGSRIHIHKYTWDRSTNINALPDIQPSIQKKLKPGLSSYARNPAGAREGIKALLDFAKSEKGGNIPLSQYSSTPVYLQATAGLRSVTPEQAEAVLEQVRDLISESNFKFKRAWARIIDGKVSHTFPIDTLCRLSLPFVLMCYNSKINRKKVCLDG
jgi:hypothetical protein